MSNTHTSYIPVQDRDFFLLLRAGLWQKAEGQLSESPNWKYILRLACEQTVQGIVADGIALYKADHPEIQVDAQVYDEFLNQSAQIIRQNHTVNKVQAKVCKLLSESGITYAVIKGQAVAQNYPKPMLRCSGDIDYLLNDENYSRSKSLLMGLDISIHEDIEDKHVDFVYEGVDIELHGSAKSYFHTKMDSMLESERERMLAVKDLMIYNYNGVEVATPCIRYHVLFLIYHILRHLTHSGIGLRQFCDLALFFHAHSLDLDMVWISKFLKDTKLTKHWNFFNEFCVDMLGMSEADAYVIENSFWGNLRSDIGARSIDIVFPDKQGIWQQCKRCGNMGHNNLAVADGVFDSTKGRHWGNIKKVHRQFVRNFAMYPKHATGQLLAFYKTFLCNIIKKVF